MTDLQARVYAAIGTDWSNLDAIAARCGWGQEGCRRTFTDMWVVVCGLLRRGLVEVEPGTGRARRIGGAK